MSVSATGSSSGRRAVLAIAAAMLASVIASPPAPAQTLPAPGPIDVMTTIRQAVGPARCHDDRDCRTSALGSLACGGPAAWIAWSVLDADQDALRDALARFDAVQEQHQLRGGGASICRVVEDPGASCVAAPGAAHRNCRLNAPEPGRQTK